MKSSREASEKTRADVERLMGQMREANERLILAAVRAQDLSDDAYGATAEAKAEVEDLMRQLREANEQLTVVATRAHTLAEEATQREKQYHRLSAQLLQLQDEERRRLAIDLHDSTAQRLAALTMSLDVIGGAGRGLDTQSRRMLAESRSLAEQCSQEVRTLSYLLHPPLLDEVGLLSALRWYVAGFMKRSGVHVDLDLQQIGRLPGPIETALFRIVQESLNNVHRHASTSIASIQLFSTSDGVELDIRDQGRGLRDQLMQEEDPLLPEMLGVGIQGMRERIRQLDGTFDITFTDTGTTVHVCVPLKADTL